MRVMCVMLPRPPRRPEKKGWFVFRMGPLVLKHMSSIVFIWKRRGSLNVDLRSTDAQRVLLGRQHTNRLGCKRRSTVNDNKLYRPRYFLFYFIFIYIILFFIIFYFAGICEFLIFDLPIRLMVWSISVGLYLKVFVHLCICINGRYFILAYFSKNMNTSQRQRPAI